MKFSIIESPTVRLCPSRMTIVMGASPSKESERDRCRVQASIVLSCVT